MKNITTKIAMIIASFMFISLGVKSQVTFSTWDHPPYKTLYATDTSAGVSTSANLPGDDIYSGLIPIGFSFTFYGTTHNKCIIGPNGNISFDSAAFGGYDPWPISHVLLGNSEVYNCICGAWCDMDMVDYGGTVSYCVSGTAPNRIFAANFCHNGMYTSTSCPGQWTTTQILLYEGTNNIEVHTAHKTVCTAWNGGLAVIGVQNSTGSNAVVAPGRDYPDTFSCMNEAWRFSPFDTTYTVTSIPFAPINYYTVFWYDSTTGSYLGSGDSLVVSDTFVATYKAYAVGCADSGSTGFDSVSHGFYRVMTVGISNVLLPGNFMMYPNPTTETLNITGNVIIYSVSITDITGREVIAQNAQTINLAIDVHQLTKGLYYVRLNNSVVKRFLKE